MGKIGKAYITAYNAVEALGWAYVLGRAVAVWARAGAGVTAAALWAACGVPLAVAQYVMLLDVVHAATGLVRSAPATAAMQVASRVLVVTVLRTNAAAAASRLGLALVLAAWCPTEVVRYAYYILKDAAPARVPRALTWLRYSTFFVLYPLGISGELVVLHASLAGYRAHPTLAWLQYAVYAVFAVYVPGSVYLYSHMIAQRKKTLAKALPNKQGTAAAASASSSQEEKKKKKTK